MRWDFRNNPIAISAMVLVISWNIALAVHMAVNPLFIDMVNIGSTGLYLISAMQAVLVVIAYASAKRTQITLSA